MLPVSYSNIEYKTLILLVAPDDVFFVLRFLKFHNNTQYSVLSLISCTDYLFRKRRFEVIYDLLSIRFNSRIRIKTFVDEIIPLKSVVGIFPSASWWEREVWDMFGVFFFGNSELRRLLTDYGFEGFPLRKDFPLSGFLELSYDFKSKRIRYKKIEHAQEFRQFAFGESWPCL